MTGIVDYGVGNLFSLQSSLAAIGAEATVSGDRETLLKADRLILPGVGAFGDAAERLSTTGLDTLIREAAASGKTVMGICLGMQLLFEDSTEFGLHKGLGLIPGHIVPFRGNIPDTMTVPHMGWNSLNLKDAAHPLMKYTSDGDFVYFVHSYYASDCEDYVLADTDYGVAVTAAVGRGNVCGCQFHPEKSGKAGLDILRAFCEMR